MNIKLSQPDVTIDFGKTAKDGERRSSIRHPSDQILYGHEIKASELLSPPQEGPEASRTVDAGGNGPWKSTAVMDG